MLLLNIDHIPGREIEALSLVKGSVVQCKSFGKDFMAGMKTFVGGEIESYTAMLNEARQLATKRMVDEAEALGADAVVNVRYASASIMQGAAEITVYGGEVQGVILVEKKRYWPFLLVIPLIAAAAAGWFLLPDELVMQVGLDGQPSRMMPKLAGLLVPVAVGAVGAGIACGREQEKRAGGLIVLVVAAVITGVVFVMNL